MNRLHKTATAAALALAILAGSFTPALAQPKGPVPTSLAVINIVTVFARLEEKKEGDREIEEMGNKINADRKKKEDHLKSLRQGLDNNTFAPNSPDFRRQQDEALQAAMDLQVFLSVNEQRLLMMQRLKTESIYRSMNEAIKKYAESHGIAIVFVADDADFQTAKDVRELTSRIAMRKVVYAHPEYDITGKIIEAMNSQYKAPGR